MHTLTIPTTHSAAEARDVMNDTARLLRQDARRKSRPVTAQAAAKTKPPTATDRYFLALAQHLEAGKTPAEARRAIQISQRSLVDDYVKEFTRTQHARTQAAAAKASQDRCRRNAKSGRYAVANS